MDKGLFFFIMGLGSLWLVMDEFAGKQRISTLAGLMTPDLSLGNQVKTAIDKALNGDPKVKEADRTKAKTTIDNNKGINTKTKKDLKDAVDAFYGSQPS